MKRMACNQFESHERLLSFFEQLVNSRNGFELDLHKQKRACFIIELKTDYQLSRPIKPKYICWMDNVFQRFTNNVAISMSF